ncbi:MAG: protein FxsA [Frankiales bacterium]|jgi:UPF0716 protein FxsA|nr:protein FxsA [Frankiales bacterium]
MGLLLLLAFLVVPVIEIYVIIQVGQAIGALPTVVLLLLDGIIGAAIVRREGAKAWLALRTAIQAGRVPTHEVADGALVVLGGALLLSPGFVTDAVGLFLVLPFTRPLARRFLARLMGRRVRVVTTVAGQRRPGHGPAYGDVIDGEVVDEDPPPTTNRPDQIGRAG